MENFDRVILLIMDSVGVGELPDANTYGDKGSNTLGNIAKELKGLNLPNLQSLGLGNIIDILGVERNINPLGSYGKMAEVSPGKDTTTGHWELAGVILEKPFPTFPKGFPEDLILEFETKIGKKTIGNIVASGTEIITELGQKHMETGFPIVYTSADSVFQIAAHEEVIPLEELYKMCEIARELLKGEYEVGRVIARPFVGVTGNFTRTSNRHDYAIDTPTPTILDLLVERNIEVMAVGKIKDIFNGKGISAHKSTKTNDEGIYQTIELLKENKKGLIFANLVDFDMLFGHRNDVEGYGQALERLDVKLNDILDLLGEKDLLIITADHGCDPTTVSTDHSREYVPLIVYSLGAKKGVNLGTRASFSDVAATIAENYNIKLGVGKSFLSEIV